MYQGTFSWEDFECRSDIINISSFITLNRCFRDEEDLFFFLSRIHLFILINAFISLKIDIDCITINFTENNAILKQQYSFFCPRYILI